jgi:ribosomal protein S17
MRIGEDVSIQECRNEGYMVMDYPVKRFNMYPKHTACRFTKSMPLYIREESIEWCIGKTMMTVDVWLDWEDLYEMYKRYEEEIKDFSGYDFSCISIPQPVDLLNLASAIDNYCGLV